MDSYFNDRQCITKDVLKNILDLIIDSKGNTSSNMPKMLIIDNTVWYYSDLAHRWHLDKLAQCVKCYKEKTDILRSYISSERNMYGPYLCVKCILNSQTVSICHSCGDGSIHTNYQLKEEGQFERSNQQVNKVQFQFSLENLSRPFTSPPVSPSRRYSSSGGITDEKTPVMAEFRRNSDPDGFKRYSRMSKKHRIRIKTNEIVHLPKRQQKIYKQKRDMDRTNTLRRSKEKIGLPQQDGFVQAKPTNGSFITKATKNIARSISKELTDIEEAIKLFTIPLCEGTFSSECLNGTKTDQYNEYQFQTE
jgi:hypothetical protein